MGGKPAIVFIPGLLCDGRLWQAQAAFLAPSHDAFTGDTTKDDTIAGMAVRILEAAPPRFALAGLSMGGYAAMEIIRQAPERITHLILCDTMARLDSAESLQRRRDFINLARMGKFKGVTPRLLPQLLAPASLETPEIPRLVMDMAEALGRDIFIRQQTAMIGRIDSRPSLPAIRCPTAVIVGELDKVTPPDTAAEMASLIPNAGLHVVPGAGHLAPLEVPALVNQIIHDLLSA